jgi:hypothetical protein
MAMVVSATSPASASCCLRSMIIDLMPGEFQSKWFTGTFSSCTNCIRFVEREREIEGEGSFYICIQIEILRVCEIYRVFEPNLPHRILTVVPPDLQRMAARCSAQLTWQSRAQENKESNIFSHLLWTRLNSHSNLIFFLNVNCLEVGHHQSRQTSRQGLEDRISKKSCGDGCEAGLPPQCARKVLSTSKAA